jgi:ribosomal-protein-alanine N-acetyltransferase
MRSLRDLKKSKKTSAISLSERVFYTDRLMLRICSKKDAPLVLSFYDRNLEEFAKYEPLPMIETRTISFHEQCLEFEEKEFAEMKEVRFFLFLKDNPMEIIGTVSCRDIKHAFYSSTEIGYKMDARFRRCGYMSEAIRFMLQYVKEVHHLHRVEAYVMPDNEASLKLLQGLGFIKEGYLHDKLCLDDVWYDHVLLTKLI